MIITDWNTNVAAPVVVVVYVLTSFLIWEMEMFVLQTLLIFLLFQIRYFRTADKARST